MKRNNMLYLLGVSIVSCILVLVISSAWIGFTVDETCHRAQGIYRKDSCTEALITQLEDETQSYRERNDAIWALGQYGDEQALPVLEKYYTGIIPDREPLDETISQYELKKAIHLLKGGFNLTVFFRALQLGRI